MFLAFLGIAGAAVCIVFSILRRNEKQPEE